MQKTADAKVEPRVKETERLRGNEMQEKAETQHDEEIGNEGGIKGGKKQKRKYSSRKSIKWSAGPVPCMSRLCLKLTSQPRITHGQRYPMPCLE